MYIKKSFNNMDHFISENKDVAFSWAAYHTRNRECYINSEKYRIEYLFNIIINFNDNTYMQGNFYKFINTGSKQESLLSMDNGENIRKENPITSDLICFSEDQFLKAS